MVIIRLSVKFFLMHILMTFILLFVSMFSYSIFPGNITYQWIIGIAYILVYWYVIYKYSGILGRDDAKHERFSFINGFLAGFIATLPALILYAVTELLSLSFIYVRFYLFPYDIILQTYGNNMHYLAAVTALIFPVATGICYPIGLIMWNKIKISIENAKTKH